MSLHMLAGLLLAAVSRAQVPMLDIHTMPQLIRENDKVVLLMQHGPSERADWFAPTFDEIARQIPEVAFGRVNTSIDSTGKLARMFRVPQTTPALRAMFKNAPPKRRQLAYKGVPSLDAVLAWAKAFRDWDGNEIPEGWEEDTGAAPGPQPIEEDTDAPPAPKPTEEATDASPAPKLPEEDRDAPPAPKPMGEQRRKSPRKLPPKEEI